MSWWRHNGWRTLTPHVVGVLYTVCNNELQTHERINSNNKKLKELDENELNATTCIIELKSAFVDVLASESGLHCPGALSYTIRTTAYAIVSYKHMKESTETTRNSQQETQGA